MKDSCAICGTLSAKPFEEREHVPVLLNSVYPAREQAVSSGSGTLSLHCCANCGFVWNAAFDDALIKYDGKYENDQSYSPSFRNHMHDTAKRAVALVPPHAPLDVLEIGAGQGSFLQTIAELAGSRLRSACGFDPAWRGDDRSGTQGVRMFADTFGPATARFLVHRPNLVVSRHTIEHVPNPREWLQEISDGLGPGAPAQVCIETPSVEWIVDHRAIQDLFYEHCSLFGAESLSKCLLMSGFGVRSMVRIFGDQYLWCEGAWPGTGSNIDAARVRFPSQWQKGVSEAVSHWSSWIDERDRPVCIWGAGAKGVTFALLLDRTGERIRALIDVNPRKQNHFIPVSGHAILSPAAFSGMDISVIVMNPNYLEEIRSECGQLDIRAEFAVL